MATIRLRGKSYRAEVYRYGVRRSRTFATHSDARQWAGEQETEIVSVLAPHRLVANPPQPFEAERAELAASSLILSSVEILARIRFQPSCGVYFLIAGEQIAYVGKSADIHSRVQQHRRLWKGFDSYTYIACPIEQIEALERHYIKTLKPTLNVAGVPRG